MTNGMPRESSMLMGKYYSLSVCGVLPQVTGWPLSQVSHVACVHSVKKGGTTSVMT